MPSRLLRVWRVVASLRTSCSLGTACFAGGESGESELGAKQRRASLRAERMRVIVSEESDVGMAPLAEGGVGWAEEAAAGVAAQFVPSPVPCDSGEVSDWPILISTLSTVHDDDEDGWDCEDCLDDSCVGCSASYCITLPRTVYDVCILLACLASGGGRAAEAVEGAVITSPSTAAKLMDFDFRLRACWLLSSVSCRVSCMGGVAAGATAGAAGGALLRRLFLSRTCCLVSWRASHARAAAGASAGASADASAGAAGGGCDNAEARPRALVIFALRLALAHKEGPSVGTGAGLDSSSIPNASWRAARS